MHRKEPVFGCVFIFCLAMAAAVPAWCQGDSTLSGKRAFEYVRTLSGESFDSRMAGTTGGIKAGRWIADQFKIWGLEPAGTNGYFQDFTKSIFHPDRASFFIETDAGKRTLAYGSEWSVPQYSGSGTVQGDIVFVGFGIVSEKNGWDDFAGLTLKGKIVLMVPYGAPSFLKQPGPEALPDSKISKAYELGARAVVMVNQGDSGSQRYPYPAMVSIDSSKYRPDMVVAGINEIAATALFRKSGIDLSTRLRKIEQDKKPCSQALGIRGKIEYKATYHPKATCRNVLAKIPGTDPGLRDEYVILGAHYDGLGRGVDGLLNPGADDNASGTAVVMEIARSMKAGSAKPKRTVVFALWDGEEEGLWGSIHYSLHPVFPLNKTIVNLNLDMVGNGEPHVQFRGLYYAPEIWELLKSILPADVLSIATPTRGGPGGSDHTPFLVAGVPGIFIQTTGSHYGRHNIGDKIELINPAALEKSAVFTAAAARAIADSNALTPASNGRAVNVLRNSTLIDLTPRDLADALRDSDKVEYFALDFMLVGLKGNSPSALTSEFYETAAAVQASKKAQLFQVPASGYFYPRFTDRFGILTGIVELTALQGQDSLLRLLGRAGLGFIIVRDADFARGEDELKRMVGAANAEGVLVIAQGVNGGNIGKLLQWSTRPGLYWTTAPEPDLTKQMALKRWRVAFEFQPGSSVKEYAARFAELKKDPAQAIMLVQCGESALNSFSPELMDLAGILSSKEWSESQIMSGGMDEFGQIFIQLLLELRPMNF